MRLLKNRADHVLGMKQISMAVFLSLAAVAASSSVRVKKSETRAEDRLVGTWKMVKASYGGQEYKIPKETTEFKHITPVHFTLVAIDKDGKVGAAIGGPYTLTGTIYEETPAYGLSEVFTNIKGKRQSFECRVEGNKWYHNGRLTSGLTVEEVWERVEKEQRAPGTLPFMGGM